jgi:hypothetical protein
VVKPSLITLVYPGLLASRIAGKGCLSVCKVVTTAYLTTSEQTHISNCRYYLRWQHLFDKSIMYLYHNIITETTSFHIISAIATSCATAYERKHPLALTSLARSGLERQALFIHRVTSSIGMITLNPSRMWPSEPRSESWLKMG